MKTNIYYILLFFVLIGCKKNELKKPTDVSFKMDINRNANNQGYLVFNSGSVLLADFIIEGERLEGEDVDFSKSFPQGLSIEMNENIAIPELIFDIPQGNYTSLVVAFNTFDDNGDVTILIDGTYTNQSGVNIPVRFEFMSSEYFSVVGEDDDGFSTIILEKDISAISLIKFDPIYWFSIVSSNMFDNATLADVNGQQTILINENVNSDIYDIVVDRLDDTTEALW